MTTDGWWGFLAAIAVVAGGCSDQTPVAEIPTTGLEVYRPDSLLARIPAAGTEEILFERALAVAVRGNDLFVLDQLGGRVVHVGADGRTVAKFGRSGDGPGELRAPTSLRLGPEGDVWVGVPSGPKIVRYRAAGGPAEDYRTPYPAVNYVVDGRGRLLIPTVESDAVLAEMHAEGDTTVLAIETPVPALLRRRPSDRLRFMGLLMAEVGGGALAFLRNKHADDFVLWRVELDPDRPAITAIDSVPLPQWLFGLMREEAETLRAELDPSFATGDFMIPFKGLHAAGGGRVSMAPSPGHRILALSLALEGDLRLRLAVPSSREEHRGLRDAAWVDDRLIALYETEVRVYRLRPVPASETARL